MPLILAPTDRPGNTPPTPPTVATTAESNGNGNGHSHGPTINLIPQFRNVLETAFAGEAAGISVIRVTEDGTKRPDGKWKHLQSQRNDGAALGRLFANGATGVGVICGIVSGGLELLEADEDVWVSFRERAEQLGCGELLARVEAGYRERTPGGGRHLFYRRPKPPGNTKLAQRPGPPDEKGKPTREPIFETRGEGGFVVVAPSHGSVHPSGRPYVLESGGFESIVSITEEEAKSLWEVARTFDEMPPPKAEAFVGVHRPGDPVKPKAKPHKLGAVGIRVGDDFNQRACWAAILIKFGWTELFTTSDGTTHWLRPGKTIGASATTNHSGSDLLYVFSTSTPFEPERSYDKFGAYAVLAHGGDFKAASKWLSNQGFGKDMPTANRGADRIEIEITPEEHEVISLAAVAISRDPGVYQRANMLVRVLRDTASSKMVNRAPGTPRISILQTPTIREKLTKNASWITYRMAKEGDGELEKVAAHPPAWAVLGLAARGEWEHVRPIESVSESPIFRPDGTIFDTPGFDLKTGILYEPNCVYPAVPHAPTWEQARKAADSILAVVQDFPFALSGPDEARVQSHAAAWLSALLTVLARSAIDGPCPLFLFDANVPGAGKTKLADIIAIIATGRVMARVDYPEKEEEMSKLLLATAIANDQMLLFDNQPSGFSVGGKSLDRTLTAGTIRGRILGRSEMTADLPVTTTFFANGNNIGMRGDALRRVMPCRIESPLERPEERTGFAIQGCILDHVLRERPRLVVAGLTILRAYFVAGRPDPKLTPMDYRSWAATIRNAIHWAIGIDPAETRRDMVATDAQSAEREALVRGWNDLPDGRIGITAASTLRILRNEPDSHEGLRDVFVGWGKGGEMPSAQVIGKRIKAIQGRIIKGLSFESRMYQGSQKWKVIGTLTPDESGGRRGRRGSVYQPTHEGSKANVQSQNNNGTYRASGGEHSHVSHVSHQTTPDPEIDWTLNP